MTLHDPHVRRRTAQPLLHAARERFELRHRAAARSVPGFMRATARGPNPPGVTCAARIVQRDPERDALIREAELRLHDADDRRGFWPAKV